MDNSGVSDGEAAKLRVSQRINNLFISTLPRASIVRGRETEKGRMLDVQKLEYEMRVLAEARVDKYAGPDEVLLTKQQTAKVCNRAITWIDAMIAAGRLPVVRIGQKDWVQRPTVVEMLVNGL